MGVLGMVVLRRTASFLNTLELVAYGVPLGVVCASLLLLAIAWFTGLHSLLVILVGVACIVGTLLLWPSDWRLASVRAIMPRLQPTNNFVAQRTRWLPDNFAWIPALVIGAFTLRWIVLWSGALTINDDGLWAGHTYIWGDWSLHMGDTAAFGYGDNFPPTYPRLANAPHNYHYLVSLTAAALVQLGLDMTVALPMQSFLFSVLILLGVYAFARRLTQDKTIAALTLALFFLGGSLGWMLTIGEMNTNRSIMGTLFDRPWDASRQEMANFRWPNVYFSLILPQRGYLYGLPLGLLVVTLLYEAIQTHKRYLFIIAGCVAGLLPFAHLSTLLALALVTPFLFLLFPSRQWLLFFTVWIVLAVPQLYLQQAGGSGAAGAARVQLGWVASSDNWLWFWLKNLGWFLPLLALAIAMRTLVSVLAYRFLLAFMPIFVIANVVVFQPWDWDNTKIFVYWFLATCVLVSSLLVRTWRTQSSPVSRTLLISVVLSMTLSGVLVNLSQLLGKDRHQMFSAEELQVAEEVRRYTSPHALFVVGLQPNHPVPVLAGRHVVISYPGWLWSGGFDAAQEERDVRSIYKFEPGAELLLAQYGVDYVVIGPNERNELAANLEAFRQGYQRVIATPNYEVFAVSPQ